MTPRRESLAFVGLTAPAGQRNGVGHRVRPRPLPGEDATRHGDVAVRYSRPVVGYEGYDVTRGQVSRSRRPLGIIA